MKTRLFIVFVLVIGLALLLAWNAAAQGPEPSGHRPPAYPPRRGAGVDGQPVSRSAPTGGAAAQGVSAAVTLGSPGLSFRYVRTFGVTEVAYLADFAHLDYPYGVGADSAGNVWAAEINGARATKYTAGGSFLMSLGTAGLIGRADDTHFYSVADVAVDGGGNVWVVDQDPDRVVKYDSSGAYQSQLGVTWESGTDNGHLNDPKSVAFDSVGNVYVCDAGNQRIQMFDSGGTYITTIGETGVAGSDNAHFDTPRHIAIDSADNLYVADAANHRVQIFDSSHAYLATIGVAGEYGSDNNHFDWPMGVAVDSSKIYVADFYNHRVQIFNRTTRAYQNTIGTGTAGTGNTQFNLPSDVAVDASGNLYVADQLNFRVQKFNSSRAYVATIGTTGVPYLTDAYHYNEPFGVAVDAAGSVAIVEDEGRGNRLIKLNSGGTALFALGQAGIGGNDNAHFEEPRAVAFDSSGRIYVADSSNNRVQIFSSGGVYQATLGTGWGSGNYQFDYPTGIAVGTNGYIYVSDAGNHRVQIYNSSRTYVATLGQTGVSGTDTAHFNWPEGVAVDGSGAIYVADANNQRVQKFNSSRAWQMALGTTGEWGSDFDHFSEPSDVAVDAGGRIYVADRYNQRVQVFSSAGAYLTTIDGSWGTNTGQMREPTGVDVDSAGNVYVADHHNQRVQKFAPGVPGWAQTNLNGFGDGQNSLVLALAPFNNQLYAGSYNANGAQLWRTGSPWTAVMTNGFGIAANVGIDHLVEFKSNLYAGTWADAVNGGEVWRSGNGLNWTQVISRGFGDPTNGEVYRFAVFSDTLYAGTWSYTTTHGTEVWRSGTGDSGDWTRVVSNGFDGNPANVAVTAMAVFSDHLYAGTENWNSDTQTSSGAEIWRTGDGSAWTQLNTGGFGSIGNTTISALAGFNGHLYASTTHASGAGAQVWRCQVCGGGDWEQVVDNGFGNSDTSYLSALEVFAGRLYFVVGNSTTGMEAWRSATGDSGDWEQVGFAGLGDSNNRAPYWDNSVTVFNDTLLVGALNYANGGEVWAYLDKQVYLPLILKNQ
jgi:hypothetical protein